MHPWKRKPSSTFIQKLFEIALSRIVDHQKFQLTFSYLQQFSLSAWYFFLVLFSSLFKLIENVEKKLAYVLSHLKVGCFVLWAGQIRTNIAAANREKKMFQKCRFLFIYLYLYRICRPQKKADINGGSDKWDIKYKNTWEYNKTWNARRYLKMYYTAKITEW